ncbi:hypothetical protein [Paenibacillus sp. MMO-58]|uniref:hypothetical protein n=1 Tax=Paenibacillus sp. MMO-58 TaxID=3081290 RepID=UPI003018C0EC
MKWVLFMLVMAPIFLLFSAWNHDEYIQTKLRAELKEGMDLATHDAALQVNKVQREMGDIQFVREDAERALLASMERTFKLDDQLQPLTSSVWKSKFEVVSLQYVETGSFPQNYNSGPPYYYIDLLRGPSVIAIVKVEHPRYYGVSDHFSYIVGSSHEYIP